MKSPVFIFSVFVILLLNSCQDKQIYSVEFDNVSGLTEDSKVVFKGQSIGEVDKIGFSADRKIIVDILIDKDFVMPENYKFVIVSLNLLGSKSIELRDLDSLEANSSGHVDKGEYESNSLLDSLPEKIVNILEDATTNQTSKQDSILIELRRLNKNLEDLKNNE